MCSFHESLESRLIPRNLADFCIYISAPSTLRGQGGGVQGLKSWKHDFEITGGPKGPPSGSTFWSGFEGPDSNKAQTGIC